MNTALGKRLLIFIPVHGQKMKIHTCNIHVHYVCIQSLEYNLHAESCSEYVNVVYSMYVHVCMYTWRLARMIMRV